MVESRLSRDGKEKMKEKGTIVSIVLPAPVVRVDSSSHFSSPPRYNIPWPRGIIFSRIRSTPRFSSSRLFHISFSRSECSWADRTEETEPMAPVERSAIRSMNYSHVLTSRVSRLWAVTRSPRSHPLSIVSWIEIPKKIHQFGSSSQKRRKIWQRDRYFRKRYERYIPKDK